MQQFSQPPYDQTTYNGSNQYVGNHPQSLYNSDDPSFWPKILVSTQLIFTQQLLVWDNSPTVHLSPGITMVFLSCGVDVVCMLVGSNYVTHLLTLWFHVAICTLYPTIKSIADLATREFTCRTSILLAKFGRYFQWSSSAFFENLI